MEFFISCSTSWLYNKHFQMQLEIFSPVLIFYIYIFCLQLFFHLMFSTLRNAFCSCSPFVCKVTVKMNLGHISITSAPIVKVDIPLLLLILFAL